MKLDYKSQTLKNILIPLIQPISFTICTIFVWTKLIFIRNENSESNIQPFYNKYGDLFIQISIIFIVLWIFLVILFSIYNAGELQIIYYKYGCYASSIVFSLACFTAWLSVEDFYNPITDQLYFWIILCVFCFIIFINIFFILNVDNNDKTDGYECLKVKSKKISPYLQENADFKLINSDNNIGKSQILSLDEKVKKLDGSTFKDLLYEYLSKHRKLIESGKLKPQYEDIKVQSGFKGLTEKYFINLRNQWFKEVLKEENYLDFREKMDTKQLFEEDEELIQLIESKQYPEGFLIYNLIKVFKISLQELERRIYGKFENNIPPLLKKRSYFTWEGLTSKIKEYILSIEDELLRNKAIKYFQDYLAVKVFNGFKTEKIPNLKKFKIEDYPEGWLILNLCKINLLSDTALGKLIDYDDLPYHLTSHRGFKGGRIEKVKLFIEKIDDEKMRRESSEILSNYIKIVVFQQLNKEQLKNYEKLLDVNPKKWLIINLCSSYQLLLRDFGRAIDFEDLKSVIQRKYELSHITIEKLREFISKTEDTDKREQSAKTLNTYLKRAIYYRYKAVDLPKYDDFKSKMHPALWLIIQICSTYLLHPFELETAIEYSEMAKRLKMISYFTNNTINKLRDFISKNGTSKQKQVARSAIKRFLDVRNEEFKRYTGPRIQNLEKLKDYPKFVDHLEYIYKLGNFPEEILEGYHEYPRISEFNKQFRYIPNKEKRTFIKKMISDGIINNIDITEKDLNNSMCNLIEFSKNYYFKPSEILPTHGSPSHEVVLKKILDEDENSIGMEIPIWMWHDDHYLTGHIDLILFIDGILYVCDYKPEETPKAATTQLSFSFMRSIPQVASYALVLKSEFKIKEIKCITFNKHGAWIYEPKNILLKLNEFIKKHKQYKADERPWEEYFL